MSLQGLSLRSAPVHALSSRSARSANRRSSRRCSTSVSAVDARAPSKLTASETIEAEQSHILQTYGRPDVVFTSGKGCVLWDEQGNEYLDMTAGIAVNALGHCDEGWASVVAAQAQKGLTHVSNLYHTEPGARLAKTLCDTSFAQKVFYCNSGAEANEGALKFARLLSKQRHGKDDGQHATSAVAFEGGFHGRTFGALSLTSVEAYRTPFEPLMPGVSTLAAFGDVDDARRKIVKGETCAVFVEPIQGEGGITPATAAFLRALREICDEAGAALVFDEVQCGLGRSGTLWAHQASGVVPDMLTAAKPLANGLPIGAVLMTDEVAGAVKPGDHGSTFAGGPLVCAAACEVVDRVLAPGFMEAVSAKGAHLQAELKRCLGDCERVVDVRGQGLLVGVEFDCAIGPLVDALRTREKVLCVAAGRGRVLRFVPPLVVTEAELTRAAEAVGRCVEALDET